MDGDMKQFILVFCILWSCVAVAGLEEGVAAFKNKEYELAMKELQPLAEQGNAEAQYWVGRMHIDGKGVPVDLEKGVRLYTMAAEQFFGAAQIELGALYSLGEGVPKDKTAAAKWYIIAQSAEDPKAQKAAGYFLQELLNSLRFERDKVKQEASAAAEKWIADWKSKNKK